MALPMFENFFRSQGAEPLDFLGKSDTVPPSTSSSPRSTTASKSAYGFRRAAPSTRKSSGSLSTKSNPTARNKAPGARPAHAGRAPHPRPGSRPTASASAAMRPSTSISPGPTATGISRRGAGSRTPTTRTNTVITVARTLARPRASPCAASASAHRGSCSTPDTARRRRNTAPETTKASGLASRGLNLHGSAQGRNRTTDTGIFNPLLYRLSYLGGWGTARNGAFIASPSPRRQQHSPPSRRSGVRPPGTWPPRPRP